MRPTYETSADRLNEVEAMKRYTKLPFEKVPRSYPFDYVVMDPTRDKIVENVEVKCRNYRLQKLPDLILSAHKIHGLASYNFTFGIKSILLVSALDGLYSIEINNPLVIYLAQARGCFDIAGRNDRNDWQDVEPCLRIPINRFHRLDTSP